ncbi:MAG: hypothetical protein R6V12_09625, partial [Candidatus Hydrogenedentota bacterium]
MLKSTRRNFLKGLACAAFAPAYLPAVTSLAGVADAPAFEFVSILEHEGLIGAHDIEIRGSLAFVAGKANQSLGRRAGRFAVLDISDPTKPSVLSTLSEEDNEGLHNAETVLLVGNTCLLGCDDLLAIDISDPAAPRITARVRHKKVARINGMIHWGKVAIAANKSGYLDVFDITNPHDPQFTGALNTRALGNLHSPHDIARFGSRHLVVPSAGKHVPVHFGIYEVSDNGSAVLPVE